MTSSIDAHGVDDIIYVIEIGGCHKLVEQMIEKGAAYGMLYKNVAQDKIKSDWDQLTYE